MPAINLIIALSHGREPSMYTDMRPDTGEVQQPSKVVREIAARDSVRLAIQCFEHARRHVENNAPAARTKAEDQLFAMKTAHYQEILNTEDFWWYHISRMESGQGEFAASVVAYRQEFVLKGRQFRAERDDA